MQNSFKNLPFFKWYFKNTRNKIVFFVIIFLLGLGYSLLHRPLGLIIFWIDNYQGYTHSQLDELNKHIANKDIYIYIYIFNWVINIIFLSKRSYTKKSY